MTPQQIADQKAFHRAELDRLDALEKAQRPALEAGQVWNSPKYGTTIICAWERGSGSTYNIKGQALTDDVNGIADCFEYVGLARDVLRVVQPDAVEQVAPVQDEPTGAELVGKKCWVRFGKGSKWLGIGVIERYDGSDETYKTEEFVADCKWFGEAKLYREGVTP